jgi:hypothetical protein
LADFLVPKSNLNMIDKIMGSKNSYSGCILQSQTTIQTRLYTNLSTVQILERATPELGLHLATLYPRVEEIGQRKIAVGANLREFM